MLSKNIWLAATRAWICPDTSSFNNDPHEGQVGEPGGEDGKNDTYF